jgi:hypothetical protein
MLLPLAAAAGAVWAKAEEINTGNSTTKNQQKMGPLPLQLLAQQGG